MHTVIQEYEAGSLKKNHNEQWYNMHLWCPIVDRCFADIKDMEPIRGESCSVASGLRKNAERTISGTEKMKRRMIGRKGDLILRTSADLEFGGAEAGRKYTSEKDTKWLEESGVKLPKMLKDMIVQLAKEVEWSEAVLRTLTIIGFVHADRRQMILELDCPEGYVCRLTRGSIYEVADSITTHITDTLSLMVATWRAKAAVRDCVAKVQRHVIDDGDILDLLTRAGSDEHWKMVAEDILIIPSCFKTPSKRESREGS
jgi:hypothetical protein